MPTNILIKKIADPVGNVSTTFTESSSFQGNVVISLDTNNPNVTAFVTGISATETKGGALIFTNGSVGSVFTTTFSGSPNYTISTSGGNVTSSLTANVLATGNACAYGVQTLTYTLTLSSGILSGNGTGTIVTDTIGNGTTKTLNTLITAVNTTYAGKACRAEFARLRNLEII